MERGRLDRQTGGASEAGSAAVRMRGMNGPKKRKWRKRELAQIAAITPDDLRRSFGKIPLESYYSSGGAILALGGSLAIDDEIVAEAFRRYLRACGREYPLGDGPPLASDPGRESGG